jgi:hypothetical protein
MKRSDSCDMDNKVLTSLGSSACTYALFHSGLFLLSSIRFLVALRDFVNTVKCAPLRSLKMGVATKNRRDRKRNARGSSYTNSRSRSEPGGTFFPPLFFMP